jgi:S-DNA-T family DNA segregation ATPase FtsK/SpoIIIE
VEPYPLLTEGTTDYFKGVPVGVDQRGTQVWGKLMACNYAIAGIMGSGKTSLVINLLCGAMLDPLVDIDVYVMAFNVDYDPMTPRLRTLVKGDEDEQITAAMDALRELRNEVTVRGKILSELGGDETKLTRAIAENDQRMRPRVVVFDECQELFRHERFGEEAKQLAIKVMMKARKVGITLIWITPAPSADSLPRDLAKTVSHRVCFAIGDHVGNDAILGSGAHRAGVTATNLVPGEDIGTAMASGFAARAGLLRTHHIKKEAGTDQITPIVQRAVALREGAGITVEVIEADKGEQLDPLADVAAVLGVDGRMRTQEVLNALAARNPGAYGTWTFSDLGAALPEGAKPYKTDGTMKLAADRVREALTERNRSEGSDIDPDELDT